MPKRKPKKAKGVPRPGKFTQGGGIRGRSANKKPFQIARAKGKTPRGTSA